MNKSRFALALINLCVMVPASIYCWYIILHTHDTKVSLLATGVYLLVLFTARKITKHNRATRNR